MPALFCPENEAAVPGGKLLKDGKGIVIGTVILHEDGKIRIRLGLQGFQQRREVGASVEGGEQDSGSHQVTPHFRKYLKTERIWRMRPRKVRVFSRDQRWVTTMPG